MNDVTTAATSQLGGIAAQVCAELNPAQRQLLLNVARYHGTHLQLQKVQRGHALGIPYHWGTPQRRLTTIPLPSHAVVTTLIRRGLLQQAGTVRNPHLKTHPTLLGWVIVQHLGQQQ